MDPIYEIDGEKFIIDSGGKIYKKGMISRQLKIMYEIAKKYFNGKKYTSYKDYIFISIIYENDICIFHKTTDSHIIKRETPDYIFYIKKNFYNSALFKDYEIYNKHNKLVYNEPSYAISCVRTFSFFYKIKEKFEKYKCNFYNKNIGTLYNKKNICDAYDPILYSGEVEKYYDRIIDIEANMCRNELYKCGLCKEHYNLLSPIFYDDLVKYIVSFL